MARFAQIKRDDNRVLAVVSQPPGVNPPADTDFAFYMSVADDADIPLFSQWSPEAGFAARARERHVNEVKAVAVAELRSSAFRTEADYVPNDTVKHQKWLTYRAAMRTIAQDDAADFDTQMTRTALRPDGTDAFADLRSDT